MVRKLAIFAILFCPVVLSGCSGCSYTTGQLGGSGSQSVTFGPDGATPSNDHGYWNGEPMDARTKK